jgi:hypothetical protein
MCQRNLVEYACPPCHVHLSTFLPFTLCENAAKCPIPRHCADTDNSVVKSSEWCIDCWVEPDSNERGGEGEGDEEGKEESSGGRERGKEIRVLARRWTGYRLIRGRECWRDDVPQ